MERARTLAIELQNREARANILQAIGIAHMRLNRPTEALPHYEESLQIKQELGDKRGMAASLVQIGEVQKTLGQPVDAEKSYRDALISSGFEPMPNSGPEHARRFMQEEHARWAPVVKAIDLKVQ